MQNDTLIERDENEEASISAEHEDKFILASVGVTTGRHNTSTK